MTPRQIGTLKYIATHDVNVDHCRSIHQITLWSLLHGEYAKKEGKKIVLTKAGDEALRAYMHAPPSFRLHEAELSERCRRLLNLVEFLRKSA
jgi:hypothetical protein